ncbi:hypothetical protein HR17_00280 [Porphyromonas gulae]|uniref:Uncharacterized protein n=1 Tax=Porphyromonas gulae TaxID=111105 RepID=A0A0A2GFJ6_9PORP|nr:hypothetical protein HQ40_01480 [Porphyromonas gulae]KGN77123.1 hypothetical protein HR17_00280 [Porphyromonas gulae]KGN87271.1 hypothetical protein HR08_02415 [Porphyromonas gulae]KGO02054.1 hypothetical protein HQ42_08915 [Porphyromonas gulae]KGO03897.1 hypothetical protein HR16_08520 [Porphyromonas gulae]
MEKYVEAASGFHPARHSLLKGFGDILLVIRDGFLRDPRRSESDRSCFCRMEFCLEAAIR